MKAVWKYEIPLEDTFTLTMPKGAELLHVGTQDNAAQLWALVDPDAPPEGRRFRLVGTRRPIDDADRLKFVGTFFMSDSEWISGVMVFHLFEKEPET